MISILFVSFRFAIASFSSSIMSNDSSPLRRHSPRLQEREYNHNPTRSSVLVTSSSNRLSSSNPSHRRVPQQSARQQRAGRSPPYTKEEIMSFLHVIHRFPITCEQWEQVAEEHYLNYNIRWSGDSLKAKFQTLYRARPGTGDPSIPDDVRFAKRICRDIARDIDSSHVGPDSQEDCSENENGDDDTSPRSLLLIHLFLFQTLLLQLLLLRMLLSLLKQYDLEITSHPKVRLTMLHLMK